MSDPEFNPLDDIIRVASTHTVSCEPGQHPGSRHVAAIQNSINNSRASPSTSQQFHAVAECSSSQLRLSFGVAEDRGIPSTMEDRIVTVMGIESLARGKIRLTRFRTMSTRSI